MSEQAALLDLNTKEYNPYWVDPAQKLLVPTNPLHYAAHRYQLILARLDIQAEKNPAQFNSGNYIAIMEKLEKLWEKINIGGSGAIYDSGVLGEDRDPEATAEVGDGASSSLDVGISADNPFAG